MQKPSFIFLKTVDPSIKKTIESIDAVAHLTEEQKNESL